MRDRRKSKLAKTTYVDRVSSIPQVARAIGIKVRTVESWRRDGMPREDDGTYSLERINEWRAARGARTNRSPRITTEFGEDPPEPPSEVSDLETPWAGAAVKDLLAQKLYWEKEWKRLKSGSEDIELKLKRGELLVIADVEREWVARVMEVRQALEALGQRLAPRLVGMSAVEIESEINDATRAICERFARTGGTRERTEIKRGPGRPRKNAT